MSKTTVSLELYPQENNHGIHTMGPANIAFVRQSLLKLALEETNAAKFMQQALRLVSQLLNGTVLFVDENDIRNNGQTESFLVCAQNRSIGSLLIDRKAFLDTPLDRTELQEIADIIGIAMLSLRQNEELEILERESEDMLLYAPDVILVLEAGGVVRLANHKAYELLGAQPGSLKGQSLEHLFAGVTVADVVVKGKNGEKFEMETLGTEGRRLASFSISLVPLDNGETQLLMVGRDVTAERQAELALRRSERATLMAQTVEYLLHEINNPLGALISTLSTLHRKTAKLSQDILNPEVLHVANFAPSMSETTSSSSELSFQLQQHLEMLQTAQKSGGRIVEAMKLLRSASRKATLCEPKSIDPAFELGLAISTAEQDHPDIHVTRRIARLPFLNVPPLHLAEIFGAILKNAAEAAEAHTQSGKQILVTGAVLNAKLVFTVEDSGPGISPALREKVFMPFFTTRPAGSAIGLGLTMAMDMVKRVGGTISLGTSAELGGACVQIVLPGEIPSL